jgi:hypothetical protein
MEVTGVLHAPAALSQGMSIGHLLDKRLGGPQSRSGRFGGERISCLLAGIKFGFYVLIFSMKTIQLAGLI